MSSQKKYNSNKSFNFTDEILIGDSSIIRSKLTANSNNEWFSKLNDKRNIGLQNITPNYLLIFSTLIISLFSVYIIITKIIVVASLIINDFATMLFVGGYFTFFFSIVILLFKPKIISLEVKDNLLYIKCFPALNKIIPTDQILKCEINAIDNGNYNSKHKLLFAMNKNGNKYKQPLSYGMNLQLIDGNNIIIGSIKA